MTQLPTGHGLLIAEKSSFMKKCQSAYRKFATEFPYTLDFECFAGHVVELPSPSEFNKEWSEWKLDTLPMIPGNWHYRKSTQTGKDKRYDAVMSALKTGRYDFIINAGDPEREGQLIQDAFFSTMDANLKTLPIYRLWSNDEKEVSIVDGLKNLLAPDDNIPNAGTVRHLSEASFLRARLDWLLGLNASRTLSIKSNSRVPVGRVQTPTLDLIVERELAIKNFKVEPFWTIRMFFQHDNGLYLGTLLNEDGKVSQFFNKEEAEQVAQQIKNSTSPITITDKKVTRTKENPPKFFSTSKLQGTAARVFGIPMVDSLNTLQYLYQSEITSYPRTDSWAITEAMAEDISDIFDVVQQVPQLAKFTKPTKEQIATFTKNKNFVNDDETRGHTALTPLPNILIDFNKFTQTQKDIFYLIARSMILPFLGPIVKEKTEIKTKLGDYIFKTNGSVIVEEGWMQAVPEYNSKDQVIPEMNIGDTVTVDRQELKEGKTTPPKRYNPDSLCSVLENIHTLIDSDEGKAAIKKAEGLGRPSTRTAILQELENHKYITCSGKMQEYYATDFGIELISQLGKSPFTSPQLTASWETKLQDLEDGNVSFANLYDEMVKYTRYVIDSLMKLDVKFTHAPSSNKEAVGTLPNGNEVFESKSGFYDKEFLEFRSECDKAKAEGQPQPAFHGFWLGKTIDTPKMKMSGSFSTSDAKKLLADKEVTKEFLWKKSNEKSKKNLKLEDGRISFVKSQSNDFKSTEYQFGTYSASLIEGTKKDGTKVRFYKFINPEFTVSGIIGGYVITRDDLAAMINQERLERELKSKSNKPFNANIWVEIGVGLKMEPVRKVGKKISDNVTQFEENGRIHYRLSSGTFVSSQIAGHTFTIRELEQINDRGKIYCEDFKSKAGKFFAAWLVDKNGKLIFDFN